MPEGETVGSFELGPYITVAALCEKVLRESDGVMSLIRVIDVVNHVEAGANPPEEMPEFRYPLFLILALKSGRARGRHEITITPELPSGETMNPITVTVLLEGEGRGFNVNSSVDIPYKYEGLYWFLIRFDGRPLTRIPLEVRYTRNVTGRPPPTG